MMDEKSERFTVPTKPGNRFRRDPGEGRERQNTEPLEGKMAGTQSPGTVSTKLQRVAEVSRRTAAPLTALAHHIDIDVLEEAFRRTRKDGAPGIDRMTASQYAVNLDAHLRTLLDRFKSGAYKASPARRVHIPKGDGTKTRPIAIPTFEDKLLQRAVTMVVGEVYEQEFFDGSYGFRPGRSAHNALDALGAEMMKMNGGWVLEADIESFFDSMNHGHLRSFLDLRIRDGTLRRAIDKWLKAGILEEGHLSFPDNGSPQGSVISPLLANVFLHEVLDKWFVRDVQPRLASRSLLIRYADDFVMVFSSEADARRVMAVLPKRFGRYGLRLHPTKTRLCAFRRPSVWETRAETESFAFLGFTHYWGMSRNGKWILKRKTAKDRFSRSLQRVALWCKRHRHFPIADQHRHLAAVLRGHYNYFGVTGNRRSLQRFEHEVRRVWRRWLDRRSQRAQMTWDRFLRMLRRHALPRPKIVRGYVA